MVIIYVENEKKNDEVSQIEDTNAFTLNKIQLLSGSPGGNTSNCATIATKV